jgi:hypothetical protein
VREATGEVMRKPRAVEKVPVVTVLRPVVRRTRAPQPRAVVPATTALTATVPEGPVAVRGRCTSADSGASAFSASGHSRRGEFPELIRRIGIVACAPSIPSPLSRYECLLIPPRRNSGECPCWQINALVGSLSILVKATRDYYQSPPCGFSLAAQRAWFVFCFQIQGNARCA